MYAHYIIVIIVTNFPSKSKYLPLFFFCFFAFVHFSPAGGSSVFLLEYIGKVKQSSFHELNLTLYVFYFALCFFQL